LLSDIQTITPNIFLKKGSGSEISYDNDSIFCSVISKIGNQTQLDYDYEYSCKGSFQTAVANAVPSGVNIDINLIFSLHQGLGITLAKNCYPSITFVNEAA
jgi:hypothetical protein